MAANRLITSGTQQVLHMGRYDVTLTRKHVRNINLRVRRDGSVCASAAPHVPLATVEQFIRSREDWIIRARERVAGQGSVNSTACEHGSTVMLWGNPLVCQIITSPTLSRRSASFVVRGNELIVSVGPGLSGGDAETQLMLGRRFDTWLRSQLREQVSLLLPLCEQVVGKRCSAIRYRSMRSRWGSCNVRTAAITLNTQLVHHDVRCLRYVITHELCHLHEPSHNQRFRDLMDQFFPSWREVRAQLNGR